MSRHRTRTRPGHPAQPATDPRQAHVEDGAAELAALCRVMPHALAPDSAGTLTGDRHAKGGTKSGPMPINTAVLGTTAHLEEQIRTIEAQAVAILNLDRTRRQLVDVITALPDWHRSLAARRQPLAREIHHDLGGWLRSAQRALGTRLPDRRLGVQCPDHRGDEDEPGELLQEGDHAELAASLIAGPPPRPRRHEIRCTQSRCRRCTAPGPYLLSPPLVEDLVYGREKTQRIVRRISHNGTWTDWVIDAAGITWLSRTGQPALTWTAGVTIRCPLCKARWSTTAERRVLARRLQELEDENGARMIAGLT